MRSVKRAVKIINILIILSPLTAHGNLLPPHASVRKGFEPKLPEKLQKKRASSTLFSLQLINNLIQDHVNLFFI